MTITLYTSRVILHTLGVVDYGIFEVIGGVVVVMSVLSATMSIAAQRFLSFELGLKDELQLKKTFNISLYTFIGLAVFLLIIAETAGLWFISNKLNLPNDRMYAAQWVFHLSVFSCILSIIQVPYTAAIISNEKMDIYAYLGIIDVVLRLCIVYILLLGSFDKLILYGFLTLGVTILLTLIYIIYSHRNFPETHFYFIWDKPLFKKIVSFAGWNLFGEIAYVSVSQGINIILNIFFGTTVNAARGLSYRVHGAITRFYINFQTALNPQIIKTYATNDLSAMFKLLFSGIRFSFYLLFILALPFLLETEYILMLWLGEVPDLTVIFCRLVIITSLIDVTSGLLTTAADAHGDIKRFRFFDSLTWFSVLPISYLILKHGGSPESTIYVYGSISICVLLVRLYLVKQLIKLSIRKFMKEVILNVIIFSAVAVIVPLFYHFNSSPGLQRFLISTIISVLSVALTVYFLGLKKSERVIINNYVVIYGKKLFVQGPFKKIFQK